MRPNGPTRAAQMILARAIYLIATGVLLLVMLLLSIPVMICQAIGWSWRWVELQGSITAMRTSGNDPNGRDGYDCTSRVYRGL